MSQLFVVAVTYGLLLTLAVKAGLFGIWLGLLVLLSLWRYSYAVLRYAAQGREEIPAPELETMNPVSELGLLGHFFAFPGLIVIWLAVTAGNEWPATLLRWAGSAVLVAAFPASAALMGLTGNLWHSLNPHSMAGVVRTLRHRYVLLLFACTGLLLLSRLIQTMLVRLSGAWVLLLGNIVMVWTLPAVFALIGSALRERRQDFYIPGEVESSADRIERQMREDRIRDWQKTLDRAYGMISSGLVAEAYRTLRQLVEGEHGRLDVYQWLFENTLAWQDKTHALQIGRRFIERLLEDRKPHDALEIFAQCRRACSTFTIPAEQGAKLEKHARSIGRHGLADSLCEGSPGG